MTRLALSRLPPGAMAAIEVDGVEVAVANVGGTCFAFGNICPHDGAPLAEGELDGEIVTCPWHGTRFNVRTGEVIDGLTDEPVAVFAVVPDGDGIEVTRP